MSFFAWLLVTLIYTAFTALNWWLARREVRRLRRLLEQPRPVPPGIPSISIGMDKEGVFRCPHCLSSLQSDNPRKPENLGRLLSDETWRRDQ